MPPHPEILEVGNSAQKEGQTNLEKCPPSKPQRGERIKGDGKDNGHTKKIAWGNECCHSFAPFEHSPLKLVKPIDLFLQPSIMIFDFWHSHVEFATFHTFCLARPIWGGILQCSQVMLLWVKTMQIGHKMDQSDSIHAHDGSVTLEWHLSFHLLWFQILPSVV